MSSLATIQAVGHALRKYASAASTHLGSDCLVHAELGRTLLAEQGLYFTTKVGVAAWRVGPGDGDVISHVFDVPSFLPAGAVGLPYHAWLVDDDMLVDFTTYQLRHKAHLLDRLDGQTTQVDWCPDALIVREEAVHGYDKVVTATAPGVFFYCAVPALESRVTTGFSLDPEDLTTLRFILKNPNLVVRGPARTR